MRYMLPNTQNNLFIENSNINYIFEGDWTISFSLLFPSAINKDIGWAWLIAKGGCLEGFCGPHILKHPDGYGIHANLATDVHSHEFFDGPPVDIGIWT